MINLKHLKLWCTAIFLIPLLVLAQTAQPDWVETQKVNASSRQDNNLFGFDVDISGNQAIAGSTGDQYDANGSNPISGAGSAYIVDKRSNGNWVPRQKLVPTNRNGADQFGFSVAISGDYAIIGAPDDDEDANGSNPLNAAGSAYIFEKNTAGLWVQQSKLVASDRATIDQFGYRVSISGNYALVAARREDDDSNGNNGLSDAGSVYVFERNNLGQWNQVQKLVASDRDSADFFGSAVDISGNYVVIGAFTESHDASGSNFINAAGSAYFFERDSNGVWTEVQKVVSLDREAGGRFGIDVSISGSVAIIGASSESYDLNNANFIGSAGAAYIVQRNSSGQWTNIQKLLCNVRNARDHFGCSVGISGNQVVVGAYREDEDEQGANFMGDAGAAYVFTINPLSGNWTQTDKVVASDRAPLTWFGHTVSISNDDIIVGVPFEHYDAFGNNYKNNAGAVYFYEDSNAVATNLNQLKSEELAFDLFPNPSYSEVNLDFKKIARQVSVRLTDLNGREVLSRTYNNLKRIELDLKIPAGIYLIELNVDGNLGRAKLIKQ